MLLRVAVPARAVLAAAALAALCCGRRAESSALPSETPVPGGRLVVGFLSDPDTLLPLLSTSVPGGALFDRVFPSLNRSTFEGCWLGFEPSAAESWEFGDGGRTLTYRLREGLRWEDGAPVTAEDVVFNYELLADPVVGSARQSYAKRFRKTGPFVEALDARTVRFHFEVPYFRGNQLAHTGFNLVPKHLLADADRASLRSHPFGRAPVGAGPFRLERWKGGDELVLARSRPTGEPGAPYLDRIVFRILPEPAMLLTELLAGRIDLMEKLDEKDFRRVLASGEFRLVRRGFRYLECIAWNARRPFFEDREVRRALTLAIDRDELIRGLFTVDGECYARSAIGTVPPVLCEAHADEVKPLPFDPEAARRALEAAGWRDGDGDGIREKEGRRFSFTLSINSGNERKRTVATVLQRRLREVGVEVAIEAAQFVAFNQRVSERDFDACVLALQTALFPDPTEFWSSGEEARFNYVGYANPRVDALIEASMRETEVERAIPLWKEIQRIVHEDQPWTFLYWMDQVVPLWKSVRGGGPTPLGLLDGVESWWVPPGERRRK